MSLFGSYINEDTSKEVEDTKTTVEEVKESTEEVVEEDYEFSLLEEAALDSITEADYISVLEGAYDSLLFEDDEEEIEEGANFDMRAAFKAAKGKYKVAIKKFRKAMKSKNYGEAKSALNEASAAVSEAEKTIRSIDGGKASSVILGYFAGNICNMLELLAPSLTFSTAYTVAGGAAVAGKGAVAGAAGTVAGIGYLVTLAKSITTLVKQIKTFIGELDNKDTTTAEAFNKYRSTLLRYLNDLKKSINKAKSKIPNSGESSEKKEEAKNESVATFTNDEGVEESIELTEAEINAIKAVREDNAKDSINSMTLTKEEAEAVMAARTEIEESKKAKKDDKEEKVCKECGKPISKCKCKK